MLDPKDAREKIRKAMQREFLRAKRNSEGHLERTAQELGLHRQQMQQYAAGVTIPADAMLMAFMKWGTVIRIEDEHPKVGEAKWWEFSLSGRDGGLQKARPMPVQTSLFDAINDLHDENIEIKILKKQPGRIELGVEIGFRKLKF